MRIAVCGCAGIGKTSLARALADRLSIPLIEEQYEALFSAGGFSGPPAAVAGRFEQVLTTKRRQEQAPNFVADRCGIDLFNLWLAHQLNRLNDRTAAFSERCQASASRYDVFIFPTWGEPPMKPHDATDGRVRVQDPWVQLRNHAAILGLASLWVPPNRIVRLPLGVGSPEERAGWLVTKMDERLESKDRDRADE
jgi:Asp-tRNA(Asn)/Glu-tRNA(Gln) amidotransferase A subunit family amidase